MWIEFAAAVVLTVVFLYLPGALLARALRASSLVSVALAPAMSALLYAVISIALGFLGVAVGAWALVGMAVAVGAVLLLASWAIARRRGFAPLVAAAPWEQRFERLTPAAADGLTFALFLVVGIVVGGVLYLSCLDSPASFVHAYDNVHHLARVQAMAGSGIWTPLSDTYYPDVPGGIPSPFAYAAGFYPSFFLQTAALTTAALGVPTTIACNAALFVFGFVVWPTSMWLFAREVFARRFRIVVVCALVCCGIAAFPWAMYEWGPLYPNLASNAIVPAAMFAFVSLFVEGISRSARVMRAVLALVALVAVAFAHPNGVFSLAAVLAPFCVWQAARGASRGSTGARRHVRAWAAGVGFAVLACVAWYAVNHLPFLSGVVEYGWKSPFAFGQSVVSALGISYESLFHAQYLAAAFAIVGAIAALASRRWAWMAFSYGIVGIIYVVSTCGEGSFKTLFSGFWYNDPVRVVALLGMVAVPLASLGIVAVGDIAARAAVAIRRVLARRGAGAPASEARRCASFVVGAYGAASAVVAAVFAIVVYGQSLVAPGVDDTKWPEGLSRIEGAPLEQTLDSVLNQNWFSRDDLRALTVDETAFALDALSQIPEGSVVVNVPLDGSAYLYGAYDQPVLYRSISGYGDGWDSPESEALRERLCDVATDESVREALDSFGADYVLLLDQGEPGSEMRADITKWDKADWSGILSITDETPGFTVVAAQDDMRLYRIDA